jgi:hypothetical protein
MINGVLYDAYQVLHGGAKILGSVFNPVFNPFSVSIIKKRIILIIQLQQPIEVIQILSLHRPFH